MKIRGIKNGAVLQRDAQNKCDVVLYSDEPIDEVSVSDRWSEPTVEPIGNGKYRLRGIISGGPYTVTVNGERFENIYVGDLWLLAGQSNMQGIGRMTDIGVNRNDRIRALYLDNKWATANHPLHETGKSYYKVHTETLGAEYHGKDIKGVGPGLAFAEKMYDLTNVPQGVISAAHGSTNLHSQWNPDLLGEGEYSLYGAAYERYMDSGSNAAGVFWYQGCSDAVPDFAPHYTNNMIKLVNAFRRDFQPDLPFVQVQIAATSWGEENIPGNPESWTSIREQQRLLTDKIDNFDTVNSVAYRLSDGIHLNAQSQDTVGRDAAEAMFCLKHGKLYGCLPGIKLRSVEVFEDDYDPWMSEIILTYDNVHGELSGGARPLGFDLSTVPERAQRNGIVDIQPDGCRVLLRTSFSKKDALNLYLWYNWGRYPCCNIVDSRGRSLPGFGPLKLSEYAR